MMIAEGKAPRRRIATPAMMIPGANRLFRLRASVHPMALAVLVLAFNLDILISDGDLHLLNGA